MLQLALEFFGSRRVRIPDPHVFAWDHGFVVHVVRPPRARRYLLRLNGDGTVRLAIPRRGTQAEAMRFLQRSEAWLLRARQRRTDRQPGTGPWRDGTRFLFRGEEVVLNLNGPHLSFAGERLEISEPPADYRASVCDHLRRLAEREFPARVEQLAREHGVTVSRVTVRAQRSRWGSCSTRGTLSLNWRLIQAPDFVADYLIIHELMHRREMNHSARFWRHVARAFPGYREAEAWLKAHPIETL